jgi:multidrug efflux pump subunit AcrB
MTLGAIAAALGLIIDDAIVVEQIHRTHEEHPEDDIITKAILSLSSHGRFKLMYDCYFSSFALMSGVAGAYFKVLTDTMIITLICSFCDFCISCLFVAY